MIYIQPHFHNSVLNEGYFCKLAYKSNFVLQKYPQFKTWLYKRVLHVSLLLQYFILLQVETVNFGIGDLSCHFPVS